MRRRTSRTSATWAAKDRPRSSRPLQERDALAANIKEEARRRYNKKNVPNPAPHRVRGQPIDLGPTARGHLQQSTCDVVGYVETHASPAAPQDLVRDVSRVAHNQLAGVLLTEAPTFLNNSKQQTTNNTTKHNTTTQQTTHNNTQQHATTHNNTQQHTTTIQFGDSPF